MTQYRELQTDLEEAFMSFARPSETLEVKEAEPAGASSDA
jgi:hypothetical protein